MRFGESGRRLPAPAQVNDYTPLHHLPRLKLIATNRRLISDAQLAGLREALPNCRLEIERRAIEH